MPRARVKPDSFTIDNTLFAQRINEYVNGRVVVANPTLQDYRMHYGSNRAIADKLVEAGYYTNVNSAMRQVQRMNKQPNLKVTPRIQAALGSLSVGNSPATISIKGYASYDGGASGWRPLNFTHTVTPAQMRVIIAETQVNGNQVGIDTFMRFYQVPVNFSFLSDNLKISIQ